MHAELTLSASTLIAFILVLSRMVGVFVFVPLPVKEAGPGIARIVFAFATALALFPRWPSIDAREVTLGTHRRLADLGSRAWNGHRPDGQLYH